MEPLTKLILNLNSVEISTFKEYLRVFSGKETKYLQLFENILKNPDLTKIELSTIIYGSWNNKYWSNITKRLEQKITDFFIAELGLEVMQRDLGENPSRTFELRKKLLGASVLRRRGHYEIMEDLVLKVIKEAEYLYLPGFIIEAGRELQAIWDNHKDKRVNLVAIHEKIEAACEHFQATQINENLYWKIKNILENPDNQNDYSVELDRMKKNAEIYPRAAFFYHYINCLIFTQYKPNSILANPHFDALEDLFKVNEGLVWPHRMGTVLFNRAMLALNEKKLDDSLLYLEQANSFFTTDRVNFYFIKRNMAWIYILKGNTTEAVKLLKKISNKTDDFQQLKYPVYITYFVLAFIEKDFARALKYLKQAAQAKITSNEEVYIKIYELITIIEQGDFDLFTLKLDTFRKWLKNNKFDNKFEAIYQIFRRMELHSFDFNLLEFEEKPLQALKNEPIRLRSDILRLDVWCQSKIKNSDYYSDFLAFVNQDSWVNT